jgi:hypothetical protein
MTSTDLFLNYCAYRAGWEQTDFAKYGIAVPVPYEFFLTAWIAGSMHDFTQPTPRDSDE